MKSRKAAGRRRAVQLLTAGVAVGAVAGGSVLFNYAPWLNYDRPAEQSRRMLDSSTGIDLARYATLAASSHNTQPWSFAIEHNAVVIRPDYRRRLPVVDPNDRELWISLGCALENLLISARATGRRGEVTYPQTNDSIQIQLTDDARQGGPLFDAIPLRQNTRSEYDGKRVDTRDLDALQSMPLEPGIELHFIVNGPGIDLVLDYVRQGAISQYADQSFVKELTLWLRFNKREALISCDGLYSGCSGNPQVPRWLGKMFVDGIQPPQQADADAKKLLSSAGAVLVTSTSDDKTAWVRTGQVYQRLALMLTSLNIKSAFLNQAVEVPALREQFRTALALGESRPQLLVRFGYADRMPYSLRRPVEQVMSASR